RTRNEQRERHGVGPLHAAPPAGRLGEQEDQRNGEQESPADALQDVAPRGMSELVRSYELDRAVTQVRLEEGVPEDHDCRRADARRLRVDVPGFAADRVDPNLRVRHSLSLLQPLEHGSYPRIADR